MIPNQILCSFCLLLLLLSVQTVVVAQTPMPPARISIDYDTRNLFIEVEGQRNGKPFSYSRRFKVTGFSDAEREALTNRILDSLGVGPSSQQLKTPASDDESVRIQCPTCTGQMRLDIVGNGFVLTKEGDATAGSNTLFPIIVSLKAGDYHCKYWQNRVLQVQKTFTVQAGKENVLTIK